jgi:hypothetical protein
MSGMSKELLALANIGPAMVRDFARLGITSRAQLAGQDPVELYERLCATDGHRHDPCVLDTFMSAVDQADGAPPRPWWTYTPERKRLLGEAPADRSRPVS